MQQFCFYEFILNHSQVDTQMVIIHYSKGGGLYMLITNVQQLLLIK